MTCRGFQPVCPLGIRHMTYKASPRLLQAIPARRERFVIGHLVSLALDKKAQTIWRWS